MVVIVSWNDHEGRTFRVLIPHNMTQKPIIMDFDLFVSCAESFGCDR